MFVDVSRSFNEYWINLCCIEYLGLYDIAESDMFLILTSNCSLIKKKSALLRHINKMQIWILPQSSGFYYTLDRFINIACMQLCTADIFTVASIVLDLVSLANRLRCITIMRNKWGYWANYFCNKAILYYLIFIPNMFFLHAFAKVFF